MSQIKPLSEGKKREIRLAVQANMDRTDRNPEEIIREDYDNEEDYLIKMASWLGISIP